MFLGIFFLFHIFIFSQAACATASNYKSVSLIMYKLGLVIAIRVILIVMLIFAFRSHWNELIFFLFSVLYLTHWDTHLSLPHVTSIDVLVVLLGVHTNHSAVLDSGRPPWLWLCPSTHPPQSEAPWLTVFLGGGIGTYLHTYRHIDDTHAYMHPLHIITFPSNSYHVTLTLPTPHGH